MPYLEPVTRRSWHGVNLPESGGAPHPHPIQPLCLQSQLQSKGPLVSGRLQRRVEDTQLRAAEIGGGGERTSVGLGLPLQPDTTTASLRASKALGLRPHLRAGNGAPPPGAHGLPHSPLVLQGPCPCFLLWKIKYKSDHETTCVQGRAGPCQLQSPSMRGNCWPNRLNVTGHLGTDGQGVRAWPLLGSDETWPGLGRLTPLVVQGGDTQQPGSGQAFQGGPAVASQAGDSMADRTVWIMNT